VARAAAVLREQFITMQRFHEDADAAFLALS
jgi:hypothetical protein